MNGVIIFFFNSSSKLYTNTSLKPLGHTRRVKMKIEDEWIFCQSSLSWISQDQKYSFVICRHEDIYN